MKHTPVPWLGFDEKANQSEFGAEIKIGPTSDDDRWGWISIRGINAQANARFLLRAVNHYDELVAALKELFAASDDGKFEGEALQRIAAAHSQTQKVLAKLKLDTEPE